MANIGTFTAEKDGFTGQLRTLTLNVKVKLVPNDKGDSENAPDFHLQAACHEIGAAWKEMTTANTDGKQVLYWYDPMYPQQRFDKPGKSPFMDMQLVPKYAGEGETDPGTVSISPRVVQNLGMRTAQATTGSIEQRLEAVGSVAYNERGVVQLQARAAGFVERLHARAPLDPVIRMWQFRID